MVAAASLMISPPWTSAQDSAPGGKITRPGVREFQVPFSSLKPDATFKIGTDADWVQITDDAVWVASSEPASVHRIDPKTNKEVAVVGVPGDPCSGLTFGFGSLWVPLCGTRNSMVRVDATTNQIVASLSVGPAGLRAESLPAATVSGSSLTMPVRSSVSIPCRTKCAREFLLRRVLTIRCLTGARPETARYGSPEALPIS